MTRINWRDRLILGLATGLDAAELTAILNEIDPPHVHGACRRNEELAAIAARFGADWEIRGMKHPDFSAVLHRKESNIIARFERECEDEAKMMGVSAYEIMEERSL